MSLITDALGLRQRRSGGKVARQAQLPPFRPAQPQRMVAVVVMVLLAFGGLAYWRGMEAFEWLESLVLDLPNSAKSPGKSVTAASAPLPPDGDSGSKQENEEKPAKDLRPKVTAAVTAQDAPPAPSLLKTEEKTAAANGERKEETTSSRAVPEEAGSISVSLAPTKEEQEKIRKAKEEERMREVKEYLRRAVIQGVSDDGEDSRVLMDGQLVGLGEKTPLLELVLDKVEPGQIVFRDEDGKLYPKSY